MNANAICTGQFVEAVAFIIHFVDSFQVALLARSSTVLRPLKHANVFELEWTL